MDKINQKKFFRKGDILIYVIFITFFAMLGYHVYDLEELKATKAEVYVDGKLKYVQQLQESEKSIFIDTELGGVDIEFKDYGVRVTTSNSPKKIAVKQGWIKKPGEVIIGIPDKLVVKILGEGENELDYVAK